MNERLADVAQPRRRRRSSNSLLSVREQQVLELMAGGLAPSGIAEQLQVSRSTVGNTATRIYRKLDVENRDQAIAIARVHGILQTKPVPYVPDYNNGDPTHQNARRGASESWARTSDRAARTAPARAAALARFEKQVDPDGAMDPQERAERAASAKRAFFQEAAAKSLDVRRAKAATRARDHAAGEEDDA